MIIDYVFPHAIGNVDLTDEVDNEAIQNTIEELAVGVEDDTGARVWDCKVKTSFENDVQMMKFAKSHTEFLEIVNREVNQYMVEVGWYEPSKPNKVTQCWWNKYDEKHHFQEAHHHGAHEVCAIYYVSNDTIPTLFHNPNYYTVHSNLTASPGRESSVTNRYHKTFPKKGNLIIFPGYMLHSVPYIRTGMFQDSELAEKNRITIAMNFHKHEEDILSRVKKDDGTRFL